MYLRQRLVDDLARRLSEADGHLGELLDRELRGVADVHRADLRSYETRGASKKNRKYTHHAVYRLSLPYAKQDGAILLYMYFENRPTPEVFNAF